MRRSFSAAARVHQEVPRKQWEEGHTLEVAEGPPRLCREVVPYGGLPGGCEILEHVQDHSAGGEEFLSPPASLSGTPGGGYQLGH